MPYTPQEHSSLGHMPAGERWVFDESVANVFGDMLSRSIPQYEVMREAVLELGSEFVRPHTQIVDLGCARGDALAPFVARFGSSNVFVGVDVAQPMLAAATESFPIEIEAGFVRFMDLDLRATYPEGSASVTLCVLTLQFMPLEHRQRIVSDAFRNTVPGGALILVEKVLGSTTTLGRIMIDHYHAYKARNGYSADEIERKRLALEGVLVPVPARRNEDMLRAAGFQEVDCFWRWLNFAAWIAVKTR